MTPKTPVCFLCEWEPGDAGALQALQRGEATPEQQRRALDWFINQAAATYQPTFVPGAPDASAFMEGRRFAGLQTVKLLKIQIEVLRKAKEK